MGIRWWFIMFLICISLIIERCWTPFHVPVGHLDSFRKILFSYSAYIYIYFYLGLHAQHMEVPSLGVQLDWNYRRWPMPQPQQCQIWAMSVTCRTAHGNARFLTHWVRMGIEPEFSWMLVRFFSTKPQWELLCPFLNLLFFVVVWVLYILWILILVDMWFANSFSHSVHCLFIFFLMVFFAVQKLFGLIQSHFDYQTLKKRFKEKQQYKWR